MHMYINNNPCVYTIIYISYLYLPYDIIYMLKYHIINIIIYSTRMYFSTTCQWLMPIYNMYNIYSIYNIYTTALVYIHIISYSL